MQDFSEEFDDLLKEDLNKYYRSYFKIAFCRPSIAPPSNNSPRDCKFRLANLFKSSPTKKIAPTTIQVSPVEYTDPHQPTTTGGDLATGSDANLIGNKELKSQEKEDTLGNIDSERWLNRAMDKEEMELDEVSHKLLGYLIMKYTGNKYTKMRCCKCFDRRAYQEEMYKFEPISDDPDYFNSKMDPKIFEGITEEEKAIILKDFDRQEAINQGFVLDIDPRACALRNFL